MSRNGVATHEEYNIVGNSWSAKTAPTSPNIDAGGAQACSISATFIVGGNIGGGGTTFKGMQEYVVDVWAMKTDLLKQFETGGYGIAVANAAGLSIWAIAAKFNGSAAATDQTSQYLVAGNSWSSLSTVANFWNSGPGWGNISDTLYIVGGTNSGGIVQSLMYGYVIATDLWVAQTSISTAVLSTEGASLGAAIYITGGSSGGVDLNNNQQFNTSTWTAKTGMTTARASHLSIADRSFVYISAGGTNSGATNTGQKYDPVGNSWSTIAVTLGTPRGGNAVGGI